MTDADFIKTVQNTHLYNDIEKEDLIAIAGQLDSKTKTNIAQTIREYDEGAKERLLDIENQLVDKLAKYRAILASNPQIDEKRLENLQRLEQQTKKLLEEFQKTDNAK